jgi:hypothetical protein
MSVDCEECGRTFKKEAYLDVHPCEAVVGKNKARAIRSQFDPGQYRLDEFDAAAIGGEESVDE